MTQSQSSAVTASLTVDDLLITTELKTRPLREGHTLTSLSAFRELAEQINEHRSDILTPFVETVRNLCGGGSAGISVYEPQPQGAGIFRWHALTGKAASFNGETTPRDFSPCGICLDTREIILMDRPGRYYDWLNLPGVPLTEALLVPLLINGKSEFGTIWIMSHDEHRFDSEDARMLGEMSSVVGMALGMLAEMKEQSARLRLAEVEKRESSKLAAFGRLAAGIAHDFNNVLTVLTGQLEIVRSRVTDKKLKTMIDSGLKATTHGEKLVQNLLAFARPKPPHSDLINVASAVEEMVETLTISFPNLIVRSHAATGLWRVLADQNQLESAILNLAVNARDAMPRGGTVTIEARNVKFANGAEERKPTGEFVAITVSDTGTGMSSEVRKMVFEPFFTTKGIGGGTGLGLSMVQKFASEAGGSAEVDSALGEGTKVTIYLPRASASHAEIDPKAGGEER